MGLNHLGLPFVLHLHKTLLEENKKIVGIEKEKIFFAFCIVIPLPILCNRIFVKMNLKFYDTTSFQSKKQKKMLRKLLYCANVVSWFNKNELKNSAQSSKCEK